MDYMVRIELYEGPYELLYHLIKDSKVNIYDVSFIKIIDQYIEYVNTLEEYNPELSSNFFFITSSLLELKSRMILPNNSGIEQQDESEDIVEINKILSAIEEYKKYKDIAKKLRDLELKENNIFYRKTAFELKKKKSYSVSSLSKAYQKYRSSEIEIFNNNKRYTVHEKIFQITQMLRKVAYLSFNKFAKNSKTRQDIISFFIALLEMGKRGLTITTQSANFGDILIKRGKKHGFTNNTAN